MRNWPALHRVDPTAVVAVLDVWAGDPVAACATLDVTWGFQEEPGPVQVAAQTASDVLTGSVRFDGLEEVLSANVHLISHLAVTRASEGRVFTCDHSEWRTVPDALAFHDMEMKRPDISRRLRTLFTGDGYRTITSADEVGMVGWCDADSFRRLVDDLRRAGHDNDPNVMEPGDPRLLSAQLCIASGALPGDSGDDIIVIVSG